MHEAVRAWQRLMSLTIAGIKRRGMAAIEEGLQRGPIHIIKRKKPATVVLLVQLIAAMHVHGGELRTKASVEFLDKRTALVSLCIAKNEALTTSLSFVHQRGMETYFQAEISSRPTTSGSDLFQLTIGKSAFDPGQDKRMIVTIDFLDPSGSYRESEEYDLEKLIDQFGGFPDEGGRLLQEPPCVAAQPIQVGRAFKKINIRI